MNPAANLQRLTPGKMPPLSARTWNTFVDTAEQQARELNGLRLDGQGSAPIGIVQVKNDTGAALRRASVLGLGAPIATPTNDAKGFPHETVIKGATPALATHRRKFVVLIDGLGKKEIGPALLTGLAWVKVNIVSTLHPFARPKDADATQLESDFWGRGFIHWQESGTGTKWCIVELGNWTYPHIIGKPAAEHVKGTTATYTIWTGTAGAAAASSTTLASVYARYGNVPAGYFARIGFDNDGPEAVLREC